MDSSVQIPDSNQQQPSTGKQDHVSITTPIPSESASSSVHEPAEAGNGAGRRGEPKHASRNKRKDLGRKVFGRQPAIDPNRRKEDGPPVKRQKAEDGESLPIYATQFSKEDIEADQRRPKKKVAVLMSYSGTGYHGMQLTEDHKTIEGDLFSAFVAAGAISKANATDPKKSSLVRCARTDKGVHAAGNIVSLKLIVEDPDVVKKINDNLASQIRVWGLVPTTKGFSSYHGCDSRIYEYLIPTHCFIPPHPSTFLAQKIREACLETGDLEEYNKRQADALTYWEETDNTYIKPILDELPPKARKEVQDALLIPDDTSKKDTASASEDNTPAPESTKAESEPTTTEPAHTEDQNEEALSENHEVIEAVRKVRAAYFKAKKTYRIHQDRVARVNEALSLYVGTKNYHNFTIQKAFSDPSSKRVIRSFQVSGEPKLINGTEWLSLKVHGQSFMMHQIRKMVAMVALVVRCGSPTDLITRAYGPEKIPIPKAPGLGLLLERPIFDNYNNRAVNQFNRQPIDFAVYDKEIEEFKQREIYERIFREEEASDTFGNFFNHIDSSREDTFLYVTSHGIVPRPKTKEGQEDKTKADAATLAKVESESENEAANEDEEGGGGGTIQ